MLTLTVNKDTILKDLELETANDLFNLINLNRNHLRKWLTWVDDTKYLEDTIYYIQSVLSGDMLTAGMYWKFGIATALPA